MLPRPFIAVIGAVALVSGCATDPGRLPDVSRFVEPEPLRGYVEPPPGSDPTACYGVDASPAVVETVSEQVMLQPAEIASDGSVLYPAVYKTETQQRIVRERRELWFETPCDGDLTPDFIASLQRALKVRGYYGGPVSGQLTGWTRRAVRAYQRPQGLDSAILSMAAARKLGLVAYDRETPATGDD